MKLLKAPAGVTHLSIDGLDLAVAEDGTVQVPDHAADGLVAAGFTVATPAAPPRQAAQAPARASQPAPATPSTPPTPAQPHGAPSAPAGAAADQAEDDVLPPSRGPRGRPGRG